MKLNSKSEFTVGEGAIVRSEEDIIKIIEIGNTKRSTAATDMNKESSRSHAMLQIVSEYKAFDYNNQKR